MSCRYVACQPDGAGQGGGEGEADKGLHLGLKQVCTTLYCILPWMLPGDEAVRQLSFQMCLAATD